MRPSGLIRHLCLMGGLALLSRSSSSMVTADQLDQQRGVQNEPLTSREIQTIARLLSDPSVFPREFKRWITDHASDSVDIAKSQVHGLVNSQGSILFSNATWEQMGSALCGMIIPWVTPTLPATNWVPCDGRYVDEKAFPALFKLIGHSYDVNVVAGKFAVPDLQGRAIYGVDNTPAAQQMPFGQTEGSQPGGRGPWHSHTVQIPEMINVDTNFVSDANGNFPRFSPQTNTFQTSSGPGGATTVRRHPSYITLNYIIAGGNVAD